MKITENYRNILFKIIAALVGGVVLFMLVISLVTVGFLAIYQGRIFPGITLGWVNLSGQTPTGEDDSLQARVQKALGDHAAFQD